YKTAFDADNVPDNKPTNKAAITWTPEGENDSITKEVEAETELNKETADYSWKNGSYNPETKEITWEIITNYRENDFDDLVVQDNHKGTNKLSMVLQWLKNWLSIQGAVFQKVTQLKVLQRLMKKLIR